MSMMLRSPKNKVKMMRMRTRREKTKTMMTTRMTMMTTTTILMRCGHDARYVDERLKQFKTLLMHLQTMFTLTGLGCQ
jgi:hypothetical protein